MTLQTLCQSMLAIYREAASYLETNLNLELDLRRANCLNLRLGWGSFLARPLHSDLRKEMQMPPTTNQTCSVRRILLVEDSTLMRRMLADVLTESGYSVSVAATATQTLRMLRFAKVLASRMPDLILLDLGLPDSDDFETLQTIKAEYPDLSVILVSANRSPNMRIRGLRLGADDYITKPYIPEELLARIDVRFRLQPRQTATVNQARAA